MRTDQPSWTDRPACAHAWTIGAAGSEDRSRNERGRPLRPVAGPPRGVRVEAQNTEAGQ